MGGSGGCAGDQLKGVMERELGPDLSSFRDRAKRGRGLSFATHEKGATKISNKQRCLLD